MCREYKLFPTAKKTAKENGLVYSDRDSIYYNFEVLDNLNALTNAEKEMLKVDCMKYHAVSWYDQPLPVIVSENDFKTWHGQFKTCYNRVFKSTGKRVMVIVTVTDIHLETWERDSRYDRYYHKTNEWNAHSHYTQGFADLEIA